MRRGVLVALGLTAAALAVGTLWIRISGQSRREIERVGPAERILFLERERVRRFWELYRQATAARTAGEIQQAVELYEAALQLNQGHEDALYYFGNLQLELGGLERAEWAWRRLVEVNPASSRGHAQLGVLYSCRSHPERFNPQTARAEFQRALEINSEETGPLIRLGELELVAGDPDAAQKYLSAVLRTNPRSAEAHFLLGYLAWRAGNRRQAEAHLEEAGRAAQPPETPGGVKREGDTHRGIALERRSSPCPSLVPDLAFLRRISGRSAESVMDSVYQRVGALSRF